MHISNKFTINLQTLLLQQHHLIKLIHLYIPHQKTDKQKTQPLKLKNKKVTHKNSGYLQECP